MLWTGLDWFTPRVQSTVGLGSQRCPVSRTKEELESVEDQVKVPDGVEKSWCPIAKLFLC